MNKSIKVKQFIFIILFIIAFTQKASCLSQCKCVPNSDPFQDANISLSSDTIQLSAESEVIGGQDVGKLIFFDSYVILEKVIQVNKQSHLRLNHLCPANFSPVSRQLLEEFLKISDFQTIISNYLKIQSSVIIFSSDKVHTDSSTKSYDYYAMKFDSKNNPSIQTANAYNTADNDRKTICVRDNVDIDITLEGYEGFDLEQGQTYEIKIKNNNVQAYFIEDSNGNTYTTQTFKYTHIPKDKWGCASINFRVQVFGGKVVGDCINIWTRSQFGLNAKSELQSDSIKQFKLSNTKANSNTGMFFTPASAPIAPITGDASSFYLYFSEKSTNALKVMKISKEGDQIGKTFDTKETGSPFDIISTSFGFVVMASDSTQKAWVTAFNKDGSQRWKRILVNNGKDAVTVQDQIKFYDEECQLLTGMDVMYKPSNGRLLYARGRIHIIWAHYNHFGYVGYTYEKNDHTGDTFMSFDADTGSNQKIYWAWRTSHSLIQTLHYDGKNIFVASLGDAFPTNINFQICDPDNHTCEGSSTLIPGLIPGDGSGNTAGRQANYIDIIGSRSDKFFIYQRKECKTEYKDQQKLNTNNEFVLIRLNQDFKLISTTKLISDASIVQRVNTIKAVRYGKNILVGYSLIPSSEVSNFNRESINQAVDESYILLLDGENGSIIYGPKKLDTYQISSADDWRILEDGRIAYTFVDNNNDVYLYLTPGLTIPNYPNPIPSSDKIYGYGTYTNSKVFVEKNNYNDKCVKQDDPNYSQDDSNPQNSQNGANPQNSQNGTDQNKINQKSNYKQGSNTMNPGIEGPDGQQEASTDGDGNYSHIINYTIVSLIVLLFV